MGALPKPEGQRARRNKTAPDVPLPFGSLDEPLRPPPPGAWSEESVRWWDLWASAPQAALFIATDWCQLEVALAVAERFYSLDADTDAGDMVKLAKELRDATSPLGGTMYDRIKLRLPVATPELVSKRRAELATEEEKFEKRRQAREERDRDGDGRGFLNAAG